MNVYVIATHLSLSACEVCSDLFCSVLIIYISVSEFCLSSSSCHHSYISVIVHQYQPGYCTVHVSEGSPPRCFTSH